MADKKFSELDPVGSLTGTEILPVIKEGLPKRTTVADVVANYVLKSGDTMTGQLVAPSYDVSGAKILSSTGFPEGVVTAPVGSIYIDKAITNGVSSWIKKSGTGNTGWSVLEGDPTITALAAHNTNGILTQTAADTFTGRTITGTANQITVTNGDGVSGNPTLSLPQSIHTGATPTFAGLNIPDISITNTTIGIHGSSTAGLVRVTGGTVGDGAAVLLGGSTNVNLPNTGVLRVGTTNIANWTTAALFPGIDSTYTLGTSSLYWSNTFTDRITINSTAYIDGATAGQLKVTGHLASASNYGSDLGTSGGAFATVRAGVFRADYSVGLAFSDSSNIQFGTVTGTKIGTAATQKLGFYNATPVVQPSATPANATDLATALTLVNDLKSKLVTLGLIA